MITQCYHQCPYFCLDDSEFQALPVMRCGHPDAPENGYIITIHNSYNRFPPRCPLIKDNPDFCESNTRRRI